MAATIKTFMADDLTDAQTQCDALASAATDHTFMWQHNNRVYIVKIPSV